MEQLEHRRRDSTETEEYKFLKCLQDAYLLQHTKKPTRWRGDDEPHVLDLVMTNEEDMISELEHHSPLGKSDHCVLQFQYHCYTILKTSNRVIKQFHKADFEKINEEIAGIEWDRVIKDDMNVNEAWSEFYQRITLIENNYVPTRKKSLSTQSNKSPNINMDEKTREKIKKKTALSRKCNANRSSETRRQCNRARNQVKNYVKKLKKEYEVNLGLFCLKKGPPPPESAVFY